MVLIPVFLADEEIERVFSSEEGVIIQDFNGSHPIGVTITSHLSAHNIHVIDSY